MAPTGEFLDPAMVIFAALAVFICWKLRSVLGVRVDRDTPPSGHFQTSYSSPMPQATIGPAQKPVREAARRWEGLAEKDSPVWNGLDDIAKADTNFDGVEFIDGARRAYEIIIAAFAKGDRDTLRSLLSNETFDVFSQEISKREQQGETLETAVVAIDVAKIETARALAKGVEISVRYEARLMSVRRDKNGDTIDGGRTVPVIEVWTFARDPRASDPNWKLIATHSAQ